MPDIFINTQRPVDRSIVAGINQPQREAPIGAYVAGSTYDTNLYFVLNDGTYDAASGAVGQDVQVAISTIATPESGTFTLTDGTDTTAAITYGASALDVETALNALNTDTGPFADLVDVVKVNDTQYNITFRTLGAQTVLSGATVSLYPESTPTASIAVTGDASTYAQQVIELTRQPAIYQQTWSTIANGFNGELALNTTRLLQSLVLEAGQPFYIEIKLNGETVAREVVGMELSTMPASAFSGTAVASLLDAFAADPTVNASFDPVAWANALSATLGAVTSVNGEVGAVVLDMDDIAETATNKILTTAERASIASALQSADIDTLAELNAIVTDATLIDTTDARLSDSRTPTTHAASHTDGTDDIQDATNLVKGLATAAQITALESATAAQHAAATSSGTGTYVTLTGQDIVVDPINITDIADNVALSTGVLTGGVLSTGAGASQYSISDGTGIIVDETGAITEVSWTGKSNITPTNIATALLTWVSIDNAGNVVEMTSPCTPATRRAEVCLGVIVHVNLTTVDAVNNEQVVAFNPGATAYDLAAALGFINIYGNVYSANGANLNLNKSVGDIFATGSNYPTSATNPHIKELAVLSALTFQYRYSDGSNGATGIAITPDVLDDGAGGTTAVTNNRWSVQRIYSFVSNNVKIQLGVEDFTTKDNAIAGIGSEAYVTEQSIADNGLLRGWLVVKKGCTDLSDTAEAQFIEAGKLGEVGSAGGGGAGNVVAELGIAVSDETTDLETGTAKGTFRMPYAMTVTGVRATVTTAPTGANIIVDINDGGTSIMTTNLLSIDATEKTSTTAATAPNITDTALADDAEITIDIDQIGSTISGAGLKIWVIGTRA